MSLKKAYNKSQVPKLRNIKNPATSDTAVRKIDELWAGSKLILRKSKGMSAPKRQAKPIFRINATIVIKAMPKLCVTK